MRTEFLNSSHHNFGGPRYLIFTVYSSVVSLAIIMFRLVRGFVCAFSLGAVVLKSSSLGGSRLWHRLVVLVGFLCFGPYLLGYLR